MLMTGPVAYRFLFLRACCLKSWPHLIEDLSEFRPDVSEVRNTIDPPRPVVKSVPCFQSPFKVSHSIGEAVDPGAYCP